ncbi:MAG: hypothetical protein C0617_05800 [Desulfuromonas sp.]|uniref:SoxR reducing system RseC family protein n=1 Tax=Desulfuromonas sp. TaxID=892 RepID=UPI000CA752D2|nr:SoxR reducing system RseC family protein [Desulfuromonas sp.]PLX85197.1 MAG: hypothetical protein C0617_05800 [Desulfuromonas sp.]
MLEEIGTVVELKGKQRAVVLCKRGSFCEHCASSGLCRMGDDEKSMLVQAQNQIGARVGDRVKIATTTKNFLQSSFFLYIVPLIGLIVGAGLGQVIGMQLENGPDPNLLAALIGTAFLVGTFLVIRVGSRAIPEETFMPRIIQILTAEEETHGH